MALTDKLSAIGVAIREKTGKTDLLTLDQMPVEIASIRGGGGDAIIKTVSGVCPITLEDCAEGSLLDYKIYGAEGGVGDQTENLFDKHYNVGYNGTAPNVAEAPGGLSTEWYAIEDIGTNFTLALNPNTATSAVVVGYVLSDDKSTIALRRGFINASTLTVGVDNFRNFEITNTSYKYVKFYTNSSDKVNDIRMYRGANNNLTVPYGFYLPIKVNDTTHKLILDYNLGAGDYLDFENRVVVKDSVPHYKELPEIPLAEGSNTFDVDTTVKPSSVSLTYVKSVKFNTMKTVEGQVPLTVEGIGQRLEDYKIYGAEGGVGDRTKNLYTGEFNKQNAKFDEPIPAGTVISVSASSKGYDANDATKKLRIRFWATDGKQVTNFYPTLDSTGTKIKFDKLSFTKDIASYWLTGLNAEDIQIEVGPVHTDYEPYGYRVDIKVNNDTSKIYIKEQLGVDDYIDFENRKVVIGGVKTFAEMPEIYLQNGQNTIDVDTTVKPSKMSVSFVDNDGNI